MATINTNDLRIKNANNFISSLIPVSDRGQGYVFVGRVEPWADDNAPPTPQNNNQTFYNVCDNLFALKRIESNDVYNMIPRLNWVSGLVYDYYRQDYSEINKSFTGATNLYDCLWVVRNQQNVVYICLNNNYNTPSTVEPLNTTNEPFMTTDGYQWQRVYDISADAFNNYTTTDFMPIQLNNVVTSTDGALSTVIIENSGGGFTQSPIGAPNQIPYYFCRIDGDGEGAVARVTVTGSVVTDIEVVRPGGGYTFGTLDFTADNCYESLPDLDQDRNSLNPGGDNTLRSTVIIPPPGGWGTDIVRELGGTRVGVFTTLNYDLFNFFTGSFRQVGIFQDATLDSPLATTVNACYCAQVSDVPSGQSYISGETITQFVLNEDLETKVAKGIVIAYDTSTGVIRYSQNSTDVDSDGKLYRFGGSNSIIGGTSQISGAPSGYTGSSADVTLIDGYASPDLTLYSGLMTYLANVRPVVRDDQQSERISLVIAF